MSKQVLSVSDFATIINLVNRELARLEQKNVVAYDLEHLKQSLSELHIEVETPEVEVKTRSSWQRDMYAVKPIKFEPPMWEEVQKFAEDVRACYEEVCIKNVMQFSTDGVMHSIYFVKSEDIFAIELTDDDEVNETFELSEAGYVLAVNKARMIFLGDENNG